MLAERGRLLAELRPCFAQTQVWLQAGKYVAALMSDLPGLNGWSIARFCGDRTRRLLNHASSDAPGAMSVVRRLAVAGLDGAARRCRRAGGMQAGALDETGQQKHGTATAGVKRQNMGCAGRVADGIHTVHLANPARAPAVGRPGGLSFRTKGQLAIDICVDA